MRRYASLSALTLLLTACAGAGTGRVGENQRVPARPPNVVMIISDDHGWADYGFMGHSDIQTPNLDRLAAESVTYTRGYAPTPLCRPSLATMITGLYARQHGITGNDPPGGPAGSRDPVRRREMVEIFGSNLTLPELLRDRGYVSFQTGKWWEGDPREHGFTAAMTHGDVARGGRHGDEGLKIGRQGMQPIYDFIGAAGDRPFFIWYAPFLPHTPHTPPERLLAKYRTAGRPLNVARYFAMVEWLDETVGELMRHLDERGLRENTIVLYASDNGWIEGLDGTSGVQARSKLSSYEAGSRTPIMVRWPGQLAPRRDDETLVSTVDLAPTVLRAAGLVPSGRMQGIDLRDRRALAARDRVFGELYAHTAVDSRTPMANLLDRSVVREDGWKLILPYPANRDVPLTIGGTVPAWKRFEPELFNVRADPQERNDLAAQHPEIVEELRGSIQTWWSVQ